MEPALQRLSRATIEAAIHQAAQVDRLIKGLRAKDFAGDPWDAILQIGMRVARG
jgi:DNA polymerase-3 subunit delta